MIVTAIVDHGTAYAMAGALTGLMSGILGIGGGMIIVPALIYIFHHSHDIPLDLEMHAAAGTSLAIMIFTAISAISAHYRKGKILWSVYQRLWPGIIFGTIVGGLLAGVFSTGILKIIFAVFMLLVAIKMLAEVHVERGHLMPGKWITSSVCAFVGFFSGLFGIGGGTLIIPFLNFCGINARKIPAVSSLCTLAVAMTGTIVFIVTGTNEPGMPSFSSGYIYWPAVIWIAIPSVFFAPIGARLTYTLPVQQLKYGLVVILVLAAIDILI